MTATASRLRRDTRRARRTGPERIVTPAFPGAGPERLRQVIHGALKRVVDPELALSIVDVGLVYGVTITGDAVRVLLTMSSAACPVADLICEDIETELERVVPAGMTVDIEMTWEPAWSAERMSTPGRPKSEFRSAQHEGTPVSESAKRFLG